MRIRRGWVTGGALVTVLLLLGGVVVARGAVAQPDADHLDGYPALTTAKASTAASNLFRLDDQAMVMAARQGEPAPAEGIDLALAVDVRAASDAMRTMLSASGLEYSAVTSSATVTAVHQAGPTATVTVDRLTTRSLAAPAPGGPGEERLGDTYVLTLAWSGTGWVVSALDRTTPCC